MPETNLSGSPPPSGPPPEPVDPLTSPSLGNWGEGDEGLAKQLPERVVVDCGWGRLLFGHTFRDAHELADELCRERAGQRDVALYLRDPHVLLSMAPERLFLDPSHTFRRELPRNASLAVPTPGITVRTIETRVEADEVNRILAAAGMVPVAADFAFERRADEVLTYAVAVDDSRQVLGTVTGVDHFAAFRDPEGGSSLWTLAVDPQAGRPGVGEALVRYLLELYRSRGRRFLDLSVLATNESAIALYRKLGFRRVPAFCVKHKLNPVNEPLYTGPSLEDELNPYAALIVDEARRRGVLVEVLDAEGGYFRLSHGGRSVTCRESLSEMTSAVAMSRCQDKRVTRRVLSAAGLRLPAQQEAGDPQRDRAFLAEHERIVVKPACGEQGEGVHLDVRSDEALAAAIEGARRAGGPVVLEELVEGEDLRVIVIADEVVAAAVRRPPRVVGTGRHDLRRLIEKQSRRREAATGGESRIPIDDECLRCLADQGLKLEDVPEAGREIVVRRAANLHSGGTIHDVTDELSPAIAEAAVQAAQALEIPVTGLDFLVPAPSSDRYWIIEANERPGLANHEPRPTAERFLDLLFPTTVREADRARPSPSHH